MFENREEAGRLLGESLVRFAGPDTVVLALPRGGVPVAFEIARRLGAPLGLAMVRKIGAPGQPELAIGAVADGANPVRVLNESLAAALAIDPGYIDEEAMRQLAEIERRRKLYAPHLSPADAKDKTAILVDDGIATGATVRAAARAIRAAGAKRLVIAAPVAASDVIGLLKNEADEVVCLEVPKWMSAIGVFYRNFDQLDDDEVMALLDEAKAEAAGKEAP